MVEAGKGSISTDRELTGFRMKSPGEEKKHKNVNVVTSFLCQEFPSTVLATHCLSVPK